MLTKCEKVKRWITEDNTREDLLSVINIGIISICIVLLVSGFANEYKMDLDEIVFFLVLSTINIILQYIIFKSTIGSFVYLVRKIRYGWYSFLAYIVISQSLYDLCKFEVQNYYQVISFTIIIYLVAAFIILLVSYNRFEFINFKILKPIFNKVNKIITHFSFKIDNAYLIIILFVNYLVLSCLFLNTSEEVFAIILLFFIIIAAFLLNYNKIYKENISVQFINLDINEILEKPIYLETSTLKRGYRLFEVKIDDLFPPKSFNKQFYISNRTLITMNERIMNYTDKFYIAVKIDKSDTIEFDLRLSYSVTNKKAALKMKCKKVKFYIDFQNCENEYIPVKPNIICIYNKNFSSKKFENRSIAVVKEFESFSAVLFGYQYNDKFLEKFSGKSVLSKHLIENKKWLYHNGEFGMGKSTADVIGVASGGYVPLPISPWEENYSHDFLALIFKKVKKATHRHFFMNTNIWIFYFALFFSSIILITPFVAKISDTKFVDNVLAFYNRFNWAKNAPIILIYLFYLFIIFSIVGFILFPIYCFLSSDIILFKKNSTKYHQEFFLEAIDNMLRNSKVILIIEDIDRMNTEDQAKIFSVLSVINKHCVKTHRYIGILSLSNKKMKKNLDYENFKNKCLLNNIFDEFDNKESLKRYTEQVFTYLAKEYNINDKIRMNKFEDDLLNISINFRDIRGLLNKIYDCNYSENKVYIEDIEKGIEEIKNDVRKRRSKREV